MFGIIVVLSTYSALQFKDFINMSGYNRSVLVQARLVSLEFLAGPPSISQDYFMFNLTFQNPTNETLTLMRVEGYYYDGGYLIATGKDETAEHIASGSSWHVLRLNKYITEYYTPPNVSLGIDPKWKIKYHLKLGPTAYKMTANVEGSANQNIQTTGPFSTDYDATYSAANTYTLSIVDAWAIGLEIVAVFLIVKESFQRIPETIEKKAGPHYIMLSMIYASQGVGVIAGIQYLFWIQSVIAPAPAEFFYQSGAGVIAGELLLWTIYFAGFAFLFLALGLFRRAKWARETVRLVSIILMAVFFYLAIRVLQPLIWQGLSFSFNLALGVLFLVTVIANAIVVYVLFINPDEGKKGGLRGTSPLFVDSRRVNKVLTFPPKRTAKVNKLSTRSSNWQLDSDMRR